ncbi:MAG: hypothetical protein ACREIT_11865 [Tepidisphaeraceae bacterium]
MQRNRIATALSGSSAPSAATGSATTGSSATVLCFGPRQLVAAIAYHIIDEGIAPDGVTPESYSRALARLNRNGVHRSIARGLWATLTNAERLVWLLSQSATSTAWRKGRLELIDAERA